MESLPPSEPRVGEDSPDAKGMFGSGSNANRNKEDDIPTLSTSIEALDYNMNHPSRGTLLLFNHREFDPKLQMGLRRGTDVDRDNVSALFRKLGFKVKSFDNLMFNEVKDALKKVAKDDHSNNDCFICVVLSHGDEGLLFAKDLKYKASELWTPFLGKNCPSLAGKPKLFFIQACQGSTVDDGVLVKSLCATDSVQVAKIPTHADFLIACSTVPGYYSWRNTTEGSWFIQALCHVFKKHHQDMDVLSMMTVVNHAVAYYFQSNNPLDSSMHEKKQIPCVSSMLTRKIFLRSK